MFFSIGSEELEKKILKLQTKHEKEEAKNLKSYEHRLKLKDIDNKAMLLKINEDHLNKETETVLTYTEYIDDLIATNKLSKAK